MGAGGGVASLSSRSRSELLWVLTLRGHFSSILWAFGAHLVGILLAFGGALS